MTTDPSTEIRDLARGVRMISCAFAFVLCYFNALLAFKIVSFEAIFADMLGGKTLPLLTTFVCHQQTFLIGLALALPLLALVAVCAIPSHRLALSLVAAILLAAFFQMILTWTALTGPLMSIISGMTEST